MTEGIKYINQFQDATAIWTSYKEAIGFYVLKKVKDKPLADEITQQVLMKVYNSCCSGKNLKNIRSWLFQIAHNTILDSYKAQQKLSYDVPEMVHELEGDNAYEGSEAVINEMLKLIPDKYAIPLKLYDLEKKKQQQIADELGLNLSATKSRIQRARVLLRDKITSCYAIETGSSGEISGFSKKKSCDI